MTPTFCSSKKIIRLLSLKTGLTPELGSSVVGLSEYGGGGGPGVYNGGSPPSS